MTAALASATPDLLGPRARATAGYADAGDAVITPRQAEYRVFARVTHRLAAALAAAAPAGAAPAARTAAFARMAEAVNDNRRLWAALAADLAAPRNGLPDSLRAQLISLAAFTLAQSDRVLNGAGTADPLVEINRSVMRGLRGDAEAE